jgi:hypothetical protein
MNREGAEGARRVDDNTVVNIAPVIAYPAGVFHKMVKFRKIKIGENLARQVADGKPAAFAGKKQAFVMGQIVPCVRRINPARTILRILTTNHTNHHERKYTPGLGSLLFVWFVVTSFSSGVDRISRFTG